MLLPERKPVTVVHSNVQHFIKPEGMVSNPYVGTDVTAKSDLLNY